MYFSLEITFSALYENYYDRHKDNTDNLAKSRLNDVVLVDSFSGNSIITNVLFHVLSMTFMYRIHFKTCRNTSSMNESVLLCRLEMLQLWMRRKDKVFQAYVGLSILSKCRR